MNDPNNTPDNLTIAYFFDWKMDPNLGVPSKVITQCTNWQELNNQVQLVVIIPFRMKRRWKEAKIDAKLFCYKTTVGRVIARAKATRFIQSNKFNIIYMRFGILTPAQIRMIRRNDTFLELNTIANYEAKNWGFIQRLLFRLSEFFSLKFARGLLAVTPEIRDYYSSKYPKIPISNFPNSIDFGVSAPLPMPNNKRANLVFVGSENRPWHGVDKLELLAQRLPEYDFHIVGATKKSINLNNVFVYPSLYKEDLLSLLQKMDLAISSLAMERTAMLQASPLKTRLYLLCGLPVIAGYIDSSCRENEEYFLYLGTNFNPCSEQIINKIHRFVEKWQGKRVSREFVAHFYPTEIEQKRIRFLLDTISLPTT